ncbi:MAG: glycosyltransferase N-terminal domain-containing protein [Methyloceanibacter sp.]|nr:glycosyltransferase N-terminal domain-containing protein [Methyloceanibacter sp.]
MLTRIFGPKPGTGILSKLASGYVRLVYATSNVKREPPDTDAKLFDQHPQILAMWHGQFMLLPNLKPERPADVKAMVSRHGDAELIGDVLRRFGMDLIRGAGAGKRKRNRGGATAMRESLRALEAGATVAMTADVPPGPARRAGAGIATLSAKSGRPVVPFAIATSRSLKLSTWSAFTINLPFSALAIVIGEPVPAPRSEEPREIEAGRQAIEEALAETTARAYAIAGAADPLSAEEKAKPGTALKTYRLATQLAAPVAPLLLAWRTRKGKEEQDRHPERYGIASISRPEGFLVWFHAASVGETNAALPLIERIAQARPDIRILLTTATVTSARHARARLPEGAIHQYVPLDRSTYVKRFLQHWRPDLAVLVESEIWPNLVLETKQTGVPLLLINARMSGPSYKRWRRRPGMSRPIFSAFDLVLAQNERLAEQFAQLGAPSSQSAGNLKADAPPPPVDAAGKADLSAAILGRSVWLAASTHSGEDEIVGAAHARIKKVLPDIVTIIVPRHPERGTAIAEMLRDRGLTVTLRSQGGGIDANTDVYVADTIGELGLFYALTPVAFVGGSLVEHGGQNPVEAVKLGAAVLAGPHVHNFREMYADLLRAGGVRSIEDADSLAEAVLDLLQNAVARKEVHVKAEACVAAMTGALPKTLSAIEAYFPEKVPMQHAS